MTKNSLEVCTRALRHIGVIDADDPATAADIAYCRDALGSILDELVVDPYNFTISWTAETVPDVYFRPLALLVAVDVAPHFGVPAELRATAIMRLRGIQFPDDREDRADLDDDGTVTDAERDAADRGRYY